MSLLEEEVAPLEEIEAVILQPQRRRGRPRRFKADPIEDGVEVPPFTIDDVASFLLERQSIWHRRFVEHQPPPWTEDETLRDWRICNIYRELDAGTRFMVANVASRDADTRSRLLNVMVYRLINRADAWEKHVGWLDEPYSETVPAAFQRLHEAAQSGEKVGTNTWRATSLASLLRSALLFVDHLDEIATICRVSTQLSTLHAILSTTTEVGEFTAYQICLDVQHVYPNLDNSEWVFVGGKGAKLGGSMWALRRLAETPDEQPIDVARRLRDTQDQWLPDGWHQVAWHERPRLSLADVDNLMCEFRKYWLKRHGQGALRRFGDAPDQPGPRRRRGSGGGRGTRRSESAGWETPPALFDHLNSEFQFSVDAAASDKSHLLPRHWTEEDDGLTQDWSRETVYCFPPFNQSREWSEKAAYEAKNRNATVVMLCPVFTETKWWHRHVVLAPATEVRFVKGMVQFSEDGSPRDQAYQTAVAVVVFRPGLPGDRPEITWAYTWPGRTGTAKGGWTGEGD